MVLSRTLALNPRPWGGSRSILERPGRSQFNAMEVS